MESDLDKFQKRYGFSREIIGKTKYGRNIEAIRIGSGKRGILINASHHAREWMTTILTMKTIEETAIAYQNDSIVKKKLDDIAVWFVPMVNPDGVTLQQLGVTEFPNNAQKLIIRLNNGSTNFKQWKSNAEGIDPNRQYPSDWNNIDTSQATKPGQAYYRGKQPLQIEETKAMVRLFESIKPLYTISYHTAGEIIFWHFMTNHKKGAIDQKMAQKFSEITGYDLMPKEYGHFGGGFNDWILTEKNGSGVTIEIGTGTGEVKLSEWNSIWKKNKNNIWIAWGNAKEVANKNISR